MTLAGTRTRNRSAGTAALPGRPGERARRPSRLPTHAAGVFAGALLLAVGVGALSRPARAADADPVVARVGSESIPRSALLRQLFRYYGRVALEQMIDRAVLDQEAAFHRVSVTDDELATRVAELRMAAAASFSTLLEREGISEEAWKERVRYGLLAEKILDRKWPVKEEDLVRLSVRYARLQTEKLARELIQEARRGVSFELLVLQRSIDKENGGLLTPNPFLRVDQPYFFELTMQQNLRPGQITPRPIESKGFWLVLKLEGYYPPSTLTEAQRREAVQRIRAFRMRGLMEACRRRYTIRKLTSPEALLAEAKTEGDSPVAQAGERTITRQALVRYLLTYFGKTALEQLIERSVVTQEAARLKVSVSDAEVELRAEQVRKGLGETAYRAALDAEGITDEAWRERVRYTLLAERVANAREPIQPRDLERLTVRAIRVASLKEAEEVIAAAVAGADFEELRRRRSLDRQGDGLLQPQKFLRIDLPRVFEHVGAARPGEVVRRPLDIGGSYLVLKVEARHPPDTLTPVERDSAVRRINALRLGAVLDAVRKAYTIEYTVPLKSLAESTDG